MGIQVVPYSLRLEPVVMEKLRFIAKDHVRSVNKEIEMLARSHIAAYEAKHGEIQTAPAKQNA